jgi:hypothetical protein
MSGMVRALVSAVVILVKGSTLDRRGSGRREV